MQNTRKSGQTLRLRKRRRPTLRIGRGSRTNSSTSHQIPARVIDAGGDIAAWRPDRDRPILLQSDPADPVLRRAAAVRGGDGGVLLGASLGAGADRTWTRGSIAAARACEALRAPQQERPGGRGGDLR